MSSFSWSALVDVNEIRILILEHGQDQDQLRGSIKHIRLSDAAVGDQNKHEYTPPNWIDQRSKVKDSDGPWSWMFLPTDSSESTFSGRQPYDFQIQRSAYVEDEYDALSYTWGSTDKTCHITIDEGTLPITSHLFSALREVRHSSLQRILWVDAICIDQDNVNERNQQVRMMNRIFTNASSVFVWLPRPNNHADEALNLLVDHGLSGQTKPLFSYTVEALQGLVEVFRSPWFSRVWIIQEVVVARSLVVSCGGRLFPWHFLYGIFYNIDALTLRTSHLGFPLRDEDRELIHVASEKISIFRRCKVETCGLLSYFRKHRTLPLWELLQFTADYEATDPRDKLYALLGLAKDAAHLADIAPDYTRSVEQVQRTLVKAMFSEHPRLSASQFHVASAESGATVWQAALPPDWDTVQIRSIRRVDDTTDERFSKKFQRSSVEIQGLASNQKVRGEPQTVFRWRVVSQFVRA